MGGIVLIAVALVLNLVISASEGNRVQTNKTTNDINGDLIVIEKAMFGAGCFWGVEAAYTQVKGVVSTEVGYTGGETENPTYREICYNNTGHAEVILIEFDPSVIPYEELVDIFFKGHDPTTLNSQGPDFGSQYRSAIFYFNDDQKISAERLKKEFDQSGRYKNKIVTEISSAQTFYRAEEYHQQYNAKTNIPACGFHIFK